MFAHSSTNCWEYSQMNSAQNFLMTSFRIFENAIHFPNKSCIWNSVTFVRSFYTQTSRSHNTQLHPSITDVIFELKSRSLEPIWPGSWRCMWLSAVGTGPGLQRGRLQLWRWVQAATFLYPIPLPNLPFCSESGWWHQCGQEVGGTCDPSAAGPRPGLQTAALRTGLSCNFLSPTSPSAHN